MPINSFFFRVHGNDGLARPQGALDGEGDLLELGVAIGMVVPFLGLAVALQPWNGYEARVRANEVLTGSDVQELLLSYYRTGELPASYTRREIEL